MKFLSPYGRGAGSYRYDFLFVRYTIPCWAAEGIEKTGVFVLQQHSIPKLQFQVGGGYTVVSAKRVEEVLVGVVGRVSLRASMQIPLHADGRRVLMIDVNSNVVVVRRACTTTAPSSIRPTVVHVCILVLIRGWLMPCAGRGCNAHHPKGNYECSRSYNAKSSTATP